MKLSTYFGIAFNQPTTGDNLKNNETATGS